MESPLVWVIGADHWPRAALRAELIERGYDAVGFAALEDAVAELVLAPRQRPRLIVFDLQDQTLHDRPLATLFGAAMPIIAVAGAAEAAEARIRALPWAAFLRRPLTLGAIADAVGHLLPAGRRPDDQPSLS